MDKIIMVTGNKHKLEIAQSVLSMYGVEVENQDIGVDEVQEEDIERIAAMSALEASKKLGVPVIKTDVGFEFDALNGFPGAFGKYVFKWLGTEGILKLMDGVENRSAKSIEVLAYAEPDGTYKTFRMDTPMQIRTSAMGTGSVMDQLMEIGGQKANYGSLTLEEKLDWWKNTDNYFHDFAKWYTTKTDVKKRARVK